MKTQPHPNPTPGSHLPASLAGLKFSRKFNFSAQSDLQRDDGRPPSRSLSALLNDVSVTLFIFSQCFFFSFLELQPPSLQDSSDERRKKEASEADVSMQSAWLCVLRRVRQTRQQLPSWDSSPRGDVGDRQRPN